ncbi:MAG: DNA mismatch repair endonuclease MutL, partial [Thermoplasmata archaeon]
AGEVVELPASVVKELVENAVDAGATAVTVRLTEGGLARIDVADDGSGIPTDELELALERHATSKIGPSDDLEGVATLGFRGEALASIASVARVRILSRTPSTESANTIQVEGGGRRKRGEGGRSVGTTVEVEGLFFNTPARRKFLRGAAVEQLEVLRTIEHLYLARPDVALHLLGEDRELGSYPASLELRGAAARVLGPEFLDQSFSVDAPISGKVRIRGVLGRPNLAVGNARRLFLAVNGRTIESRPIAQAVRFAFQEYIPRTRFPVGVLHLDVPAERVDVNVHPTKREVRLSREGELVEEVRVAVRRALQGAPALARIPDAPFGTDRSLGGTRRAPADLGPTGRTRRTDPAAAVRALAPAAAQQRLSGSGPP